MNSPPVRGNVAADAFRCRSRVTRHTHRSHPALACIMVVLLAACGNKGDLYLEPDAELEQQLDEVDRALDTLQSSDIDASLDELEREEAEADTNERKQKTAPIPRD